MKPVRAILLGLLQQGALYGYQINKMLLEPQFSDWAEVPTASLYHELARLAEEGLIEQVSVEQAGGRPARTIYQITQEGLSELKQQIRQAWADTPLDRSPHDIAAFFMTVLDDDELKEVLAARLAVLAQEKTKLGSLGQQRLAESDTRPTLLAVLEHARLRIESESTWTQHLLDQIAAGAFAPAAVAAPTSQERRTYRKRSTEGLGAFTFVLHTHLPYCRLAGRWPHGEEWIHEALAETYVPLLSALYDLRDAGVDFRLTMSLTPVLTEQLADRDIREHFVLYLEEEIDAAMRDIPRFGEEEQEHLEYLARFYRDTYQQVLDAYLNRFHGDVIGAFRQLQDEGYLEIITCAATHGYLPLLGRDASIYGQLRTAVESYTRHFGRTPRAIWLPECAYRPAYIDEQGVTRPAIEEFLAKLGITCFFVETHAIEGGNPVGKAGGDVGIGPYPSIKRHYVMPSLEKAGAGGNTFTAYHVIGSQHGLTDPPVSVIGRNNRTGQQVWSGEFGYPGDKDYREFHRKDQESGLQYWRVTGSGVELGDKDVYHPDWAADRVKEHAQHYAELVEALIIEYHGQTSKYGLISSNYDTELFGHWWFEGIDWIKQVLEHLSESDVVDLVTASEYITRYEPDEAIALPESSWGAGGNHWTWDNPATHWMWEPIHAAELRMEALVQRFPQAEGASLRALNQAARELLLTQSSDWPFLVTTGQAGEYASKRFRTHLERFGRLADLLQAGDLREAAMQASEYHALDNLFPHIDYRWFQERQGRA